MCPLLALPQQGGARFRELDARGNGDSRKLALHVPRINDRQDAFGACSCRTSVASFFWGQLALHIEQQLLGVVCHQSFLMLRPPDVALVQNGHGLCGFRRPSSASASAYASNTSVVEDRL